MSTAAIDTGRNNERLSAFLSEIETRQPVDNIFQRNTTLDALMKNKKTQDGGRQIIGNIDSGTNSTVKWFSDYDVFDTSPQDTALTFVYPMVNLGGTITISWEEIRETAGSDHKLFDLVAHKRNNALMTMSDTLNSALHAATAVTGQITSLPVAVDSTGSVGGLSQATDSDWASVEVASAGAISSVGLTELNNVYNTLINNKSRPDTMITDQASYELYEDYVDADVRYGDTKSANRGFNSLMFKNVPVQHDLDCAAGVWYMLDSNFIYMKLDTEGNFMVDEFQSPVNQKVSTAKICFRGNMIITNRRGNGKLTGIT